MDWLKKRSIVQIQFAAIGLLLLVAAVFVGVSQLMYKKNVSVVDAKKTLDGNIALLSTQIQENPNNVSLYISLSRAYLQKVRETADSAYYQKIDDLMNQAEKIDTKNPDIPATRASVALGRHHFREGQVFTKQALALDPHNNVYYGLLGDAEIELGQYKEAVDAFQKMANLRPDYGAYVRIAYIRELMGDMVGAKESLRLAITSGSSFKENVAFAYVELGKLDLRDNPLASSEDFNRALQTVPDYPTALEGLGKIAFFAGDIAKAEEYFMKAYTKLPIVQFATDLGDLYTATSKKTEAAQYVALAQVAFAQSEKSGIDTNLEQSLFLSDHELNLPDALNRAQMAHHDRPSVYAADYLAWALYKNGQFKNAGMYEKDALRLGETDPLILFHQGLIAAKNGDTTNAKKYLTKSLKINPRFSMLQSRVASETLTKLTQ